MAFSTFKREITYITLKFVAETQSCTAPAMSALGLICANLVQ